MSFMKNTSQLIIPFSIIVAGMIIGSFTASAIIFVNRDGVSRATKQVQPTTKAEQIAVSFRDTAHAEVTANDRIRGSVNATVKFIDYSDTECPFCKRHHETLTNLLSSYDENDVAWVYRHLPLSFHLQAMPEAIATECVAKVAGEDAFWKFLGRIYEETTSNDGLNLELLPKYAEESGVKDMSAYRSCYVNEETREKVESDLADAERAGGTGTPYSRLVSAKQIDPNTQKKISDYLTKNNLQEYAHFSNDGFALGVSGALPQDIFATLIDELLAIN